MEQGVFVETYHGNGRPTGHICEARHRYEAPEDGAQFGTYRGPSCWHNITDGYLAPSVEAAMDDFLRGEHIEIGHAEYEPGCPLCRRWGR